MTTNLPGQLDPELRTELLAMEAEDQAARWRALESADPDSEWSAVGEIDRRNTRRLKEIVARYGWPGRSLVGDDGAHAAWLLVQHAGHDLQFQRECLELLDEAAAAGEARAADHAYLVDRVAVAEGRPQLYGTQFRRYGDRSVLAPIADPDRVEERRAALGLPTLADYIEQAKSIGHGRARS